MSSLLTVETWNEFIFFYEKKRAKIILKPKKIFTRTFSFLRPILPTTEIILSFELFCFFSFGAQYIFFFRLRLYLFLSLALRFTHTDEKVLEASGKGYESVWNASSLFLRFFFTCSDEKGKKSSLSHVHDKNNSLFNLTSLNNFYI